jgi:hypothetical protein
MDHVISLTDKVLLVLAGQIAVVYLIVAILWGLKLAQRLWGEIHPKPRSPGVFPTEPYTPEAVDRHRLN